jgi:hypothetical protein
MIYRRSIARLLLLLAAFGVQFWSLGGQTITAEAGPGTNVLNPDLAEAASRIFAQLPAPTRHFSGLNEAEASRMLQLDAFYQELMRDRLEQGWFAALTTPKDQPPYSIQARFATWRQLMEFLAEHNAVVEVWAYGEAGETSARRIPAPELAKLNQQAHEQPTAITVTYRDETNGKAITSKLEFGFHAAEAVRNAEQAYSRHRTLQLSAREILSATNTSGLPDGLAQWTALQNQVLKQQLPVAELPALPKNPRDIFVAFEFEMDDQNNFAKVVRIYQDSQVQKKVLRDTQILLLQVPGEQKTREVIPFARSDPSGKLVPMSQPILGQDVVELRVKDSSQPDPEKWHVLEFGEPEILKESALAHFAQLNAYLERKRKARAMTQANVALVAEPIIAGLNVGGGLAGLGFPAGEAVRLAYNLVTWRLISDVPSTRQMRELFALMAARDRTPEIKLQPERFLTKEDIQTLKQVGSRLSDVEVEAYLQVMSDEDVRAMLRLARQGMIDARVTTFLNTLTSVFKVSGVSDHPGVIRDIFNNVRFSVNGDINISTLLLLALGKSEWTALSGVSLHDLGKGEGPPEAWLQYLVISVDIRAVLNTIVRLTKSTLAKKELEKPFPYSPRLSELAAYEVRIFGFPLLMYYKRGLIKADRDAYENDYAYGLYGVRLAEHFRTREEMEAEIRAGHMFPLGLVKVPSATGGWKETDLAVYAHQVQTGKFRGKTVLVIYGLKAYSEYSELIGRELERFKQYEKGLRQGAVIEQRVWEKTDIPGPSTSYEPVIHVGSNTVQEIFAPLFGNLQELRRCSLLRSWGLPVDSAEYTHAKQELKTLGVVAVEADPLLQSDPHNSSFVYRRQVGNASQTVKITAIPSLADIERGMRKAEEGKLIEEIRTEAAAGKTQGVVFLNEGLQVNGHLEVGPLLRDSQGQLVGAGVTSGPKAIREIFDLIKQLPVTDRARLRANHFAATVIELEHAGKGTQKVFLTIEFPIGEGSKEETNSLSGEVEINVYADGLLRRTLTDRRIVELEYDAGKVEVSSRTYDNRGTRRAPVRGVLLEETRTLDYWLRDFRQPGLDPYEPTIAKLRFNYIIGQVTRETYGLFELPIETVDDQYIVRNRYTPYGLFESATVLENGRAEADFSRLITTKVREPVSGRERYQLKARFAGDATSKTASYPGHLVVVERTNLIKGIVKTETLDVAHFGRKVREDHLDPFDGTRSFSSALTWDYKDDFYFGLVPVRTVTSSASSATKLAELTTLSYDPLQRRLVGMEVNYTGKKVTNVWDYRWEAPIEVRAAHRRTTSDFNREETSSRSTTITASSGETLEQGVAKYDPSSKTWMVTCQKWYRAGIPERTETNLYSAFGLLISARSGNSLETRLNYTSDGIEQATLGFRKDPASGRYEILERQRDDYQWQNGECNSRTRLYIDGLLADDYRSITDEDGRIITDGIRTWPLLELRTTLAYDGDSERVDVAKVFQNGQLRASYQTLGASQRPAGDWVLKVKGTPFWGLTFTNTYLLGDPRGGALQTEFENGDKAMITDWFGSSAIERSSELTDRHGHLKARFIRRPNAGTAVGLPFDLIRHYKLDPWGKAGLAEEKAALRGTDVALFSDKQDSRIQFDLTKVYDSPQYAVDPSAQFGLQVVIAGAIRSNITAVFSNRFLNWPEAADRRQQSEPTLELTTVSLQGFFYHFFSTRTFDRAGNLLQESAGSVRALGPRAYSDEALFSEMGKAAPVRTTTYLYQPGVFQDQRAGQPPTITFAALPSRNPGDWNVNDAGWREWPTEVNGFQLALQEPSQQNARNMYHFRRLSAPRWFERNPYLPGVTNAWMEWTSTEFDDTGKALCESSTVFDAAGESSAFVAHKVNSQGRKADKIVYHIPTPLQEEWQTLAGTPGAPSLRVNLGGLQNLSACDFLAFYLDAPISANVSIHLQDRSRHSVAVTEDPVPGPGTLSFWPVGSSEVNWLPDQVIPQRGSVLVAPPSLIEERKVFAISVPDLARAGLHLDESVSSELEVSNFGPSAIRATPLRRLDHGGAFIIPSGGRGLSYDQLGHSSGLKTNRRSEATAVSQQTGSGGGWNSIVRQQGFTVASLYPRSELPHYPILQLIDDSNPDVPRPLYQLAAENGQFIDYFHTALAGDTAVSTIVHGFDTPKLEVFRAGVLDDEISPGILAFGYGYYVAVPLAKAGSGLFKVLAGLHNRCVASAFTLGGDKLLPSVVSVGRDSSALRQFAQDQPPATAQVQEINQLPTLAEALLPRHQAPWAPITPSPPAPSTLLDPTNALKNLYRLSRVFFDEQQSKQERHLIPTSFGTEMQRYVDTVQEAGIIELAVKLHDLALARELLTFYYEKSQGGTFPVHTFYEAKTGASLTKRTQYKRASDAEMSATAQLAISEAAFCVGTATGDTNALALGKNLVELLLDQFRPNTTRAEPRGIAENGTNSTKRLHRMTLWPDAKTFSLASNARAYLLFSRISEHAEEYRFPADWALRIREAALEQATWLTNQVAPHVLNTGIVPKGLFEIQDVRTEQTALALDRWTTTEAWLSFIEAADRIGIKREVTRLWLDNLARAHGVTIDGIWGLDWTIALQRPDAISTELTARFLRVAELLEHRQAADFASQSLSRLRQGRVWPAVLTAASTQAPLKTGQGSEVYPIGSISRGQPATTNQWPETLGVYAELADAGWPTNLIGGSPMNPKRGSTPDITQFFWTAAGFYFAMVAVAVFWWTFSWVRRRRRVRTVAADSGSLVPEPVMQKAEERWSKRVLGMRVPAGAEHSRYSNAAIEQNFLLQLRAIYKLVLEWRRVVNQWSESDPRLVEDGQDPWLNGLDEFAVMVGIFTRWVVKAGRKDGAPKSDPLQENEDSNHIWSRLVMYFSESHLRLLRLIEDFKANPAAADVLGKNDEIELALRLLGVRARPSSFDARNAFDAPAAGSAMDLLLIQLPGVELARIAEEMERKLDIPRTHFANFIKGYKSFKEREQSFPLHPYVLETAKMLPHFLLMGLVALIWYNNGLRGLNIMDYLKESAAHMAVDPHSLIWAVPLFAGFGFSIAAHAMRVYRFRWATQSTRASSMALDAEVSSLFGRGTQAATPALRIGGWWNPRKYERLGWVLRAVGLALLALALFQLEPPTFATFVFVKGLLGVVLLLESACLLGPLLAARCSAWLEDHVSANPAASPIIRWANQLNIVSTRPASLVWLSLKYHFQPSVPTGGPAAMVQAIFFYLLFAAVFFFVGSYMFTQALEIWFQETYRSGWDVRLVIGSCLFWMTMYLLRFGLFVLFAALSSAAAVYPFKVLTGLVAITCLALQYVYPSFNQYLNGHLALAGTGLVGFLVLVAFEAEILGWLRAQFGTRESKAPQRDKQKQDLERDRLARRPALGVVYMSGDDLSFHKLTSELLMTRLKLLRDKLSSSGLDLLSNMHSLPEDAVLAQWFASLYALETKHDATLWHPMQLVVAGGRPSLPEELGLNLFVESAEIRDQMLTTWHLRRWLVTMMSTAGHSQDTAINLVDIALTLQREGFGASTAFYLIQNKYDNNQNNRPSQIAYDKGELGQRNKLARLLMELAPGSRAYSVNDWTPFGFKAGGLVGMDLVFEESLHLTNMLVLDRNANAHDLEAVMADIKLALHDPGVVIVIPGRSTTNTLTPIGQSSQLIEEGQRALIRGVMMLGGTGSETLGTGWGNLQAIYYGPAQRALCDVSVPKMPLTTSSQRGATFGDRYEGLIGFGPHAIGISEDIWGVTQAAHNALALGYQIKFCRSRALWHKIRETWSHAEWLAAFPRWSGGYLQMMLDPIMQRINDFGPLSVFAKEIRANGGRFFLGAPAALLSILLMPLAIICDASPFVQILILLWNLGLVMNQVLTALGLVACLEGTGFKRSSAIAGALGMGVLVGTFKGLGQFAIPLLLLGFITGGFAAGLGRWAFYRGRDVVLFGPQLVIHALGQVIRQSLEFVLSGASANDAKAVNMPFRTWVGPREDRPFEKYQNFVNLRTVVWGVGLASLFLDLFALANLDFLNVLLLLPTLMFSVSTLVGPFLMQPKPGNGLGRAIWIPKLLGWLASFAFYMLLAKLIALGGWFQRAGLLMSLIVCWRVISSGLKYFGYSRRLGKLTTLLDRQLVEGGLAGIEAKKLAEQIVRVLSADVEKTKAALQKTAMTSDAQASVMRTVQQQLLPLLSRPVTDLNPRVSGNPRFRSEWNRSFVLGLFTLIWFFVVPMPGLLVFTAPHSYRISISPSSVLHFAGAVIVAVLVGGAASLLLDRWEIKRLANNGLMARIRSRYETFQSLAKQAGRLTPLQISHLYATFTDVQTYFDQRSYAYAHTALDRIEKTLKAASESK